MTTQHGRLRARTRRWLSVLSCGVVAGAISAALTGLMHRGGEWLVETLAPVPVGMIGLAMTIAMAVVLWSIGHGRWQGIFGVRRFVYYPPRWLAAVLALVTWAVLVRWLGEGLPPAVRGSASLFLEWPALAAIVLIVAAAASSSWASLSTIDGGAYAIAKPPLDVADVDFDWIFRWLRTDDAIEHAMDDQFGHRVVADRIAQRVFETDQSSTLALIGARGSGKTTIGKLVKTRLASYDGIVFVHVSLWPFETPEAAVRGVLDAVMRGLATRVDVSSLTEVRQQYIDAIKTAGSRFESLASMLTNRRGPEDQLNAIKDVVLAAGLRVVLWIDDLERFSGVEELDESARAVREVERVGPIRALLYLLDQSSEISVILATTSLETRFDIDKIARIVERPPRLSMAQVARLIVCIRRRCLADWPMPVIDPASKSARQRLDTLDTEERLKQWLFAVGDEVVNPELALCAVLATPRSLKNTLRSVLDVWATLPGEVDFDDLCFATALRESSPSVFAVVDDTIGAIRLGYRDWIKEKKPEDSEKWKRLSAAVDGSGLKTRIKSPTNLFRKL